MDKVLSNLHLVAEIAIRIPPSDPERLVRFALGCKKWMRVVTSDVFGQVYAERYGMPPFIGYFLSSPAADDEQMERFVPSAPSYPCFSPDIGTLNWYALDVRHGRVLLFRNSPDLIVWLPLTGEHFLLPEPPRWYQYHAGAVVCAESPDCKDPRCYSVHDFNVIFAGSEDKLVSFNNTSFFEGNETWVSIYSSKASSWGQAYVLKDDRYAHTDHPLVEHLPPVLHKNSVYFTLETHALEGEEVRAALKFNLATKELSVLLIPEDASPDAVLFFTTTGGFTLAGAVEVEEDEEDDDGEVNGENKISLWTLSDSSPTVWTRTSDISLETILPFGAISPGHRASAVGFFEGEDKILIDCGERIFAVELGSLQAKDIGPSGNTASVLPFSQFCLPSNPKAEDDEDNGSGESESTSEGSSEKKTEGTSKRIGSQVETRPGKKARGDDLD